MDPDQEARENIKAARECEKNPGHESFTPVYELTKRHVPKCFDAAEVLELIKAVADLTVRLKVYDTSFDRPVEGYYGACGIGKRIGTGHVLNVRQNNGPCQCYTCAAKLRSSRKSWKFEVCTAKHIVFDEIEANATWVDLFYDREKSISDGSVKTVRGGEMKTSRDKTNESVLRFTTCDASLGAKLEKLCKRQEYVQEKLQNRYSSDRSRTFVWVVSHPHGMAKQVTFGEMKDKQELRNDYQYSYLAEICPGSDGARLWGLSGCKSFA